MKNIFNSKLLVSAVLMMASVAHAGTSNLSGDGSVLNPYQMGTIGSSPTVLAATIVGTPSLYFEEYPNFTISGLNLPSGSANTYYLSIFGVDVVEITNLTVEVWDSTHPLGSFQFATFTGNNTTTAFGTLADGQYHLDISGYLGDQANIGQYSIAISAVPEPETYAMLLAGLGLIGFSARRRRTA